MKSYHGYSSATVRCRNLIYFVGTLAKGCRCAIPRDNALKVSAYLYCFYTTSISHGVEIISTGCGGTGISDAIFIPI